MGHLLAKEALLPLFCGLLKDAEAEVRMVAAEQISRVVELLPLEPVITEILPILKTLSVDEVQNVREALAGDVMLLSHKFGTEGTSEHLLDLFLHLLKDDVAGVRLNIISKLDQVCIITFF
jgi:serine/threonine-protein phosphatase 2A regulatory subunit A